MRIDCKVLPNKKKKCSIVNERPKRYRASHKQNRKRA